MIATVTISEDEAQQTKPCIVRWTGAKRFLKIVVQTYCEREVDASVGVMQLPDKVMNTGHLCQACVAVFQAYERSL